MKDHRYETPLALTVIPRNPQGTSDDQRRLIFPVLRTGCTANILRRLGGRS